MGLPRGPSSDARKGGRLWEFERLKDFKELQASKTDFIPSG